jgi:S1-C subfamily serine protease
VNVDALDLVLMVLAVAAAVGGWRQGLIGGVLSFTGFLVGAAVGALVAPRVIASLSGVAALAVAVGIVIVAAGAGNAVALLVGGWIRRHVTWRPARLLDSVGGSMFGVLTLALVAWLVASATAVVPLGVVSTQVRGSAVLGQIDRALPDQTRDWLSGLRSALDSTGLPEAISGFSLDPELPVEAPDPATLRDPAVRRAVASVVKVEGIALDCGTKVDGSGFVVAPDRVMTNAHVVAGVAHPKVLVGLTGRVYDAEIVYLDPRVDVAVLSVRGLDAPALSFAAPAAAGDSAVVAGFPGGGRLTATPARVRGVLQARGSDIYGHGGVTREVYSVRGTIRPGNSGGPLLSPTGAVDGVVFATALDDPETGYALTAREVAPAVREGTVRTTALDPGDCTR